MKQYMADVAQYGAGADPKNGQIVTGYNVGAAADRRAHPGRRRWTAADAGQHHERRVGDDSALPLSFGGKAHVDGIKDAYPAEYFEMLQYDASKGAQVPTGDVFDVEGQTGVFGG